MGVMIDDWVCRMKNCEIHGGIHRCADGVIPILGHFGGVQDGKFHSHHESSDNILGVSNNGGTIHHFPSRTFINIGLESLFLHLVDSFASIWVLFLWPFSLSKSQEIPGERDLPSGHFPAQPFLQRQLHWQLGTWT